MAVKEYLSLVYAMLYLNCINLGWTETKGKVRAILY